MLSRIILFLMVALVFSQPIDASETSSSKANSSGHSDPQLCDNYCDEVMGQRGVCTLKNQTSYDNRVWIYKDRKQCMDDCSKFPKDGVEGAVSGDSVQCRTEHAILAQGDEGPVKHCPHASPGGGGVCVDRSPCVAYCVFYYDRVEERDCPALDEFGGRDHIGNIDPDNFIFSPSKQCMETCANFAAAGQPWEMSGDSANCRQQYYLMAQQLDDDKPVLNDHMPEHKDGTKAHHLIDGEQGRQPGDKLRREHATKTRKIFCSNAEPKSKMCSGYSFGDYYKSTQPNVCRELCFSDEISCESQYGKPEQCMSTCQSFVTGTRQDTTGNTAQCRLSWLQLAVFAKEDSQKNLFCSYGSKNSVVCAGSAREPVETNEAQPSNASFKSLLKDLGQHH